MSVVGVEGEEREDLTAAESRQLSERSFRLLKSLLAPLRGDAAAASTLTPRALGHEVGQPAGPQT